MKGQSGQVRRSGSSGGRGPWVSTFTEAQPSRWALPRQSALVSPPPRITTFLPAAEIETSELVGRPAFLLHYGDAAVDDPLFDLVVGDSVPEEAADPIVLLEDDGGVPGPVELLRRGEPGWPATDDGDLPACTLLRRCRPGDDPSLLEGPVDYGEFYLLYSHGLVVDGEDARGLARRRTEHPRELGEVVGLVQAVYGLLPVLAVDEVVPVGDQVPQGAAGVAERHAAVHAARGLALELLLGHRLVDVAVVLDALLNGPLRGRLASDFEESFGISH